MHAWASLLPCAVTAFIAVVVVSLVRRVLSGILPWLLLAHAASSANVCHPVFLVTLLSKSLLPCAVTAFIVIVVVSLVPHVLFDIC